MTAPSPPAEAWVIEAVRTPYGARGGALSAWHPVDLLALALGQLLARAGAAPSEVQAVVVGCGAQVGAQAANIARRGVLAAGWPESVPATTIEQQASSSAQAVHLAAQAVMSGTQGLVVAAGIDVMSAVPAGANLAVASVGKPFGRGLTARYQGTGGLVPPGQAAEAFARLHGLGRRELDRWALRSTTLATQAGAIQAGAIQAGAIQAGAIQAGASQRRLPYLVGVPAPGGAKPVLVADEALAGPRKSAKDLRALPPLWGPDGVITAGNMAADGDGAAAVLVASPAVARRLGLVPKAKVLGFTSAGAAPGVWPGAGAVAAGGALERAGVKLADVERFEVHESSAAAVLGWARDLGASEDLVNPEGGALAYAAPVGAAGAGLFAPALQALADRRASSVLVCVAADGGVGTACLLGGPPAG